MKRTFLIQCTLFVSFVVLILSSVTNPSTATALLNWPNNTTTITSTHVKDETLHKKVQSYANEYKIKPIDATVDRVWKAIPGYNGLAVDIEASFQKMRIGHGFDVDHLVYNHINIKVTKPKYVVHF